MSRFLVNLYWYLRRWWGTPKASDAQRIGQRLDGISARLMTLEAEQRRMWQEGWRVPPARVVPLRSVVDDN